MNWIVCVDNNYGVLFNNRRQSKDIALRRDILEFTGGQPLWVSPYTAGQFLESDPVRVHPQPAAVAQEEHWCFAEDVNITPYIPHIYTLVLYRWNRTYPADAYFPAHLLEGWHLVSRKEFAGNSHKMITREVYQP